MKRTTRKLSGNAKDRFLDRFFAVEEGLTKDLAERLAARSKATFTSVRIRRAAISRPHRPRALMKTLKAPRLSETPRSGTSSPVVHAAAPPDEIDAGLPFDAYSIGLVPVFQREGRDGLISRLAVISKASHLRQLAKAQQIVLPQEMRSGDVDLADLRAAIADAVARRIADRRAAAG